MRTMACLQPVTSVAKSATSTTLSSSPEIEKDLRLVTSTHTRAADSVEGAVKRTLTSGATYSSSPRFGRLLEQHSRAEQGEGKHKSIFNEQIHPPKVEYPPGDLIHSSLRLSNFFEKKNKMPRSQSKCGW